MIVGIQATPMQMYCADIKGLKNKLPRGMESKCGSLREVILKKIKIPITNRWDN